MAFHERAGTLEQHTDSRSDCDFVTNAGPRSIGSGPKVVPQRVSKTLRSILCAAC
jgi:hypothetical protein